MKNSYPNHLKIEVLQYLEKVGSIAKASRKYGVHPSTVYGWKYTGLQEFLRREPRAQPDCKLNSPDLAQRVKQLEQENAVLREAAKLYFMYA